MDNNRLFRIRHASNEFKKQGFTWQVFDVDPSTYNPLAIDSVCSLCPAISDCSTLNQTDKDGVVKSHRLIMMSDALLKRAAATIPGIGNVGILRTIAEDLRPSNIAPLLPCTASTKYLGATSNNNASPRILARNERDPLYKNFTHDNRFTPHWTEGD